MIFTEPAPRSIQSMSRNFRGHIGGCGCVVCPLSWRPEPQKLYIYGLREYH